MSLLLVEGCCDASLNFEACNRWPWTVLKMWRPRDLMAQNVFRHFSCPHRYGAGYSPDIKCCALKCLLHFRMDGRSSLHTGQDNILSLFCSQKQIQYNEKLKTKHNSKMCLIQVNLENWSLKFKNLKNQFSNVIFFNLLQKIFNALKNVSANLFLKNASSTAFEEFFWESSFSLAKITT